MRRARELFQQALALDPSYAPAWSGLADTSAVLASWQFAEPAEMFPIAADAARRALELDESLAEAHASLGFVKMHWEWDWDGVLREFRRAIELNPNHETAHRWLSAFLAGIGRSDEAMPIAERALLLDPISVLPLMNIGIVHMLAGDLPGAEVQFRRVIAKNPTFPRAYLFLGTILSLQGKHEEGIRVVSEIVERGNRAPIFVWALGVVYALAGRVHEARELLDPIVKTTLPALYRAEAHLYLGERDAALTELQRGVTERSDWMYSIGTQPFLNDLHDEPRFEAVLTALALPAAPSPGNGAH